MIWPYRFHFYAYDLRTTPSFDKINLKWNLEL